jgi:Ca2+-binding RTX toxin-like protein
MSPVELWHWVHSSYGEELGLTDSDCDYIPPSLEDKYQYQQLTEQLMVDKDGEAGSDAVIAIATAAKVRPTPSIISLFMYH